VDDDLSFPFRRWKVEIKRNKALACARLEILGYMLITGIVRNHELKTWSGLNQFAGFVDRENSPIVPPKGG
jgi:hypothetical protein